MGNLGNAYTAIGEYQEAIKYHERRLAIANEANDLVRAARWEGRGRGGGG